MKSRSQIPPSSNTGVTNPNQKPIQASTQGACSIISVEGGKTKNFESNTPKYDWFSGRLIGADPDTFFGQLAKFLTDYDCGFDSIHDTAKQGRYFCKKALHVARNYGYSFTYLSGTEPLVTVSYGGANHKHGLYLDITGGSTDILYDAIYHWCKSIGVEISCGRVDVAVDFIGDFKKVLRILSRMATSMGYAQKLYSTTNPDGKNGGRTLYIDMGAGRKLRIYEKGLERALVNAEAPEDWIRFELEFKIPSGKPYAESKMLLAKMLPEDILSLNEDVVKMLNRVTDLNKTHKPIQLTQKPEKTSMEQKLENMVNQYGPTLRYFMETPERFNDFLAELYPNADDVPTHLRKYAFSHIENQSFLKHGEY